MRKLHRALALQFVFQISEKTTSIDIIREWKTFRPDPPREEQLARGCTVKRLGSLKQNQIIRKREMYSRTSYLLIVIMAMKSNERPTFAYCKNGITLHRNSIFVQLSLKNLKALKGKTMAQNKPSAIPKLQQKKKKEYKLQTTRYIGSVQ